MMKSRGLRPANCYRAALQTPLHVPRQFSTHASLLRPRNPSLGIRSPLNTPAFRTPLLVGSSAFAIRFASTSPAAAASPVFNDTQAAAAAGSSPATTPSLEGVTDDFLTNIASMPEQIGYLKAIGLDYGWGPTASIEWLLEHVHIWMSIPWWSSIIVTAVVIRTALFPLFAQTSDVSARQVALTPITTPLNAKMQEARLAGNTDQMMMARAELQQVFKAAGINPLKAFYAPVAQAVMGYCSWKLLRAMAALPVPGLETGGFAWLTDLTIADPFYILPIAFGSLIHIVGRAGGETGAMRQLTGLQRKFLLYIMPGLAVLFTVAQPAAVQLSFFTASGLGMLQARLFQNAALRDFLGLSPLVKPTPAPSSNVIDAKATVSRPGQFKYEAPTVKSSVADAKNFDDKSNGNAWTKVTKSVSETVSEAKEFRDGILKRTGMYQKNTGDRKQSEAFKKRAEEYEKRRSIEQKQEAMLRKQRRSR